MIDTNINTPVADDIRAHFGKLLSPDTEIEIIPHTRVWATDSGVLLWSPKDGYSEALTKSSKQLEEYRSRFPRQGREPKVDLVPASRRADRPEIKTVIYLTGPAGSGKSALVSLMSDAVELNRSHFIGFTDLGRNIAKHAERQTVVITNNDMRPEAFDVDNALAIWCRERKIKYLHINLTSL